MLESVGDVLAVVLGLTVVWFLGGSPPSEESRQRRGGHSRSEQPSGRDGAGEPSRR